MFELRYEGLRELVQSLRTLDTGLYQAVLTGLNKAGEVIRADATAKFESWGAGRPGVDQAAQGFRVLVRPNTATMALVSVGQTIRRSTDMRLRRSNFGSLQMTKGLLLARTEKLGDAVAIIDEEVTALIHSRGF